MQAELKRPGDPELAMIEALEASIADPGHTFDEFDEGVGAWIERLLFAKLSWTYDESCTMEILPMGRSAARRFRERQANPLQRKRALPDMYLRHVWDRCNAGSGASPTEFLATNPNWCGDLYTPQELERAGKWLYERGLISGTMMNNSDAPVRVTITPAGEELVEADRSVHARAAGAGGSPLITNISGGNVNLAQQSQHVTQTQDNRTGSAAALDLVDAILARVAELSVTDREPVEAAVAELRAEATGPARGSLLRDLSNKAVTAAVTACASAGITNLLEHLMPHLQQVLTTVIG